MKKICFLLAILLTAGCLSVSYASEPDGDLYTFCPAISTIMYNSLLKNILELDDDGLAPVKVALDSSLNDCYTYSDIMKNTVFIFDGASDEYATGTTAYIQCSLEDKSTLKNIPMLVWAATIQYQYYGEIKEDGTSFLEWVNNKPEKGSTFSCPYFIAYYSEDPLVSCSLLLVKR